MTLTCAIPYSIAGGVLGVLVGTFVLWKLKQNHRVSKKLSIIMIVQLLVIVVSIVLVYSTSTSLKNREGLPIFNQMTSWIIIGKRLNVDTGNCIELIYMFFW
jgi:phosphatidylinositol glycan class N